MKPVQKQLAIWLALLSCAAGQNTAGKASVQGVSAVRDGSGVRVEVTLSAAVQPAIETAVQPDRILLDLPDTICSDNTKNVAVNANGVLRVRTGQHSTRPLITRVVLDLDRAHPYTLKAEGNRLILTVGPAENARRASRGAPVAATSGNLIGVFRRRHETVAPITADESASSSTSPPPAPVSGPPFEPPASASSTLPPPPPPLAPASPSRPAQGAARQPSFEQNQIAVSKPAPVEIAAEVPVSPAKAAPVATPAVSIPSNEPVAAPVAESHVPASKDTSATAAAASETEAVKTAESAAVQPGAPETESSPGGAGMLIARADDPSLRTVFKVKYVAEGVAYLEGGRAQGLAEGMKLEIEETNLPARQGDSVIASDPRVVAELVVSAVAETSAVTDIHDPKRPVKAGDLAYLSRDDANALVQQRALSATRQYPAVISFTEGDTLDEEVREQVPRPPLPSVNRARGRIGFDTIATISHGTSSVTSSDVGIAFRGDITRIGGTYWNVSGYWRGRLTKESAASQQTLQNLINRTYHLNMTYDNPNSTLVAGFGRLYLPWAPSLDTIDGGYFGKRLSKGTTLGIFGGSTPDPSSWDYSPNRAIGGAFINFEGGEYDGLHYSATSGAGLSMVNWAANDPFVFIEDSVSYKRDIAVYESAQFDSPKGNSATPSPGPGLGRNFFTLRVNPFSRLELDANYNYFRQIPTFDPTLVGTGLLDKYLFQGFSAGGRLEIWKQVWISTNLGRSTGTGDAKASLNQMYGITWGRVPKLNMRADVHYSRFNSSFGTGFYESLSFSRQMSDRLRLELLLGQQNFASPITINTHSRFLTSTVETTLGPHYYLQSNFTTNRGDLSYDQFMFSVGYRFDSKRKGE